PLAGARTGGVTAGGGGERPRVRGRAQSEAFHVVPAGVPAAVPRAGGAAEPAAELRAVRGLSGAGGRERAGGRGRLGAAGDQLLAGGGLEWDPPGGVAGGGDRPPGRAAA